MEVAMIKESARLFKQGDDLEMRKLRLVATCFFCLWIMDTMIGTFSGCRILQVNAFITFNTCAAVAACAVSLNYCRAVQVPFRLSEEQTVMPPKTQALSPLLSGKEQQGQPSGGYSSDCVQGFNFAAKRLQTLISFGAAIFTLFGSLTVLIESIHEATNPGSPAPKLLLFTGVIHALFITTFGGEVDAHDRISGIGLSNREPRGLPSINLTIRQVLRRPLLLFSRVFCQQSRIVRIVLRAFSAFICMLVSLLLTFCGSSLWETIGVVLLAVYVLTVAVKQVNSMAWLLLNNAVCQPVAAAKCERAIRSVQLVSGVMQIKSSCFWEVSEGELMALVHLILLTSADPSVVTQEAHRILANVATYVFVEVMKPGEEDDLSDEPNSNHHAHAHSHDHDHDHSHSHTHSHEHGHSHDYLHDHLHGTSQSSALLPQSGIPAVATNKLFLPAGSGVAGPLPKSSGDV